MELEIVGQIGVDLSSGLTGNLSLQEPLRDYFYAVQESVGETWLDYETFASHEEYVAAQLERLATPRHGHAATVVQDNGYDEYVLAVVKVA